MSQQSANPGSISLTTAELQQLIANSVAAAVAEAKKPYVDADAVARKERHRTTMREQIAEEKRNKALAQSRCSHMREDNTCRIAWMRVKNIIFGVCQKCFREFNPDDKDYAEYLARPTGAPQTL